MTELHRELLIVVEVCLDFGHDPSELLLVVGEHPKDRFKSLIIQFTLQWGKREISVRKACSMVFRVESKNRKAL